MIPLVIDFTQEPPEGIKFENGKIFMNTKDPDTAEKMQEKVFSQIQNKDELQDMTKLFLNHRLRLAADLDLFEDLLEHLEEENRIIEEKSDRMSQLSMSISRTSQNIQRKSISASFASKENFDGFAVSKL